VVARGKIILADKKGDSIPEGWAIDVDGHPTTDAAKALEGCVLPFGGAKGSGIAMMIDVFSGVLSGAAYGSHIHNPFAHPEVPMDTGHCMIAIDISRFQDPEEFKTTMDTYRSEVKGLKPAAGVEEIFMPGEIECNNYRKNLEAGPQLSLAVYRELEGLCEKLHIPFDILKK
jgi:LDH2 family malate/lactate/ureidoglycolate dehydrogenase